MDYKCEAFNEGEILRIHHKLSDIFRQYLPTFQVILMFYLIKNSQKKTTFNMSRLKTNAQWRTYTNEKTLSMNVV